MLQFLALLLLGTVPAGEPSHHKASPLPVAETLIASQVGVDRRDNLWAWNYRAALLRVFSGQGEPVRTLRAPELRRVDFDSEFGLAGINWPGNQLVIRRFGKGGDREISLPTPATDVVWIDRDRVALGMQEGTATVHIFDLAEQRIVERLGTWQADGPFIGRSGPGMYPLRNIFLKWDRQRNRLWALETLTGQLTAFSPAGKVLHEETLVHPRLGEILQWIRATDEEMKAEGRRQETTPILWTSFILDNAGSALLVERCESSKASVQIISSEMGQSAKTHTLDGVECCSIYLASWQQSLIFHRTPEDAVGCNSIRKWP